MIARTLAASGQYLRSGGGFSYPVIGIVHPADLFELIRVDGGWAEVQTRRLRGYMYRSRLAPLHAVAGVHGGAAEFWSWDETNQQQIRDARLTAVKILCAADAGSPVVDLLRGLGVTLIVARTYIDPYNKTAEQYAAEALPSAFRLYSAGVRYFEVHNEPNLYRTETFGGEGMGEVWRNGAEFAVWWLKVRDELRYRMPLAKFGMAAMSPGAAIPNVRYDPVRFMAEADSAAQAADWIAMHCYWLNGGTGWQVAIQDVIDFANKYSGKCVMVTEYSNVDPSVDKRVKAEQYVALMKIAPVMLPLNVQAMFAFVLDNPGFPNETWKGSPIAEIVGRGLA